MAGDAFLADWTASGQVLAGAFLLVGGFSKAADIAFSGAQIERFGILSDVQSQWAAGGLAIVETGLGAALLAGYCSTAAGWLGLVLLAGLPLAALRLGAGKGIKDCGCYGKLLLLTPLQSVCLNALVSGLLLAWLLHEPGAASSAGTVQLLVVLAIMLAAGVLARHTAFNGGLLLFSAFRPGRRWPADVVAKAGLIIPPLDPNHEDAIVVFATQTCGQCQAWLRVLDRLAKIPGELPVLGVIAAGEIPLEDFRRSLQLTIPLVAIAPSSLLDLWSRLPAAVLVRDGRVAACWRTRLPPDLVERVRLAKATNG